MPTITYEKLCPLAMWSKWQDTVKASLPNFCASTIYVEQHTETQEEFDAIANHVKANHLMVIDLTGKLRDATYGARVVDTKAYGKLTRMWLDNQVEFDFLLRHLDRSQPPFSSMRILDIGAGYGRFAVPVAPLVKRYTCVDAVPISTFLCDYYCTKFGGSPDVKNGGLDVLSLPYFCKVYEQLLPVDLAINCHSWNECSLESIQHWLTVLREMKVPYLFTVSHGVLTGKEREPAYQAWSPGQPSWKKLLEQEYDLIAEECIGFTKHPHALWRRR